WLSHLSLANICKRQSVPFPVWDREKEIPVFPFAVAQLQLRSHINRLQPRLGLAADRAHIHTNPAPGAVFHSHLQRVAETLPLGESSLSRFKAGGRQLQECLIIDLAADDRVRTYQDAFPALDAKILIPYGHLLSKIALFQTRSPGRKRAISRHSTDRNFIAATN